MKKRYWMLIVSLTLATMPIAALAETKTYSDQYISFDYDDELPGLLYLLGSGDSVKVAMETGDLEQDYYAHPAVTITVSNKINEEILDSYFHNGAEAYQIETISEDPLEVIWKYDNSGHVTHCRLLGRNDNQCAYVLFHGLDPGTDQYSACESIYNSVKLSVDLNETYIPEEWFHQRDSLISNTLPFSGDIIPYLEGCAALCDRAIGGDNYVTIGIEANDLRDSVDTIAAKSGYHFDEIVSIFMPYDFTFSSLGIDNAVEAKIVLQEVIDVLQTQQNK